MDYHPLSHQFVSHISGWAILQNPTIHISLPIKEKVEIPDILLVEIRATTTLWCIYWKTIKNKRDRFCFTTLRLERIVPAWEQGQFNSLLKKGNKVLHLESGSPREVNSWLCQLSGKNKVFYFSSTSMDKSLIRSNSPLLTKTCYLRLSSWKILFAFGKDKTTNTFLETTLSQ